MAPPKVAPRASVVEAAKATGKLARRSSVVKEHSPMDGPPPLAAAMLPASGVASGEFYWVSDDKSAWVAPVVSNPPPRLRDGARVPRRAAEKKPQSVLISGESGAGKTETTKKILALIAHATASGDASETSIEKQIMQSNPILESFGNAKTLRNDNSSRFGKWMIIELGFKDTKPAIAGCRIDHYLLETARVSRQLHGERNYHALYMAQTLEASRGLKLKGAAHRLPALRLAAEFAGLTDLLGDLERGLTHKEVPQPKGEPILSPLRPEAAADARDALAKALYGRCFSWLVETVDGALEAGGGITKETLVGVLDIFGFEVFKQNSFEQLCINLANEKLQNTSTTSRSTESSGRAARSTSSATPGGSDAKFVAVLNDHHADHAHYSKAKPSMSAMCFTVHHFAGPVTYDAVGWLEKNADALLPGLRRCLAKSKNPLVAKLFPPAVEEADAGGRAKKKGNATIASKFKADLGRLDAQLRDTAPHFARCVKPNQLALPGRFENPLVLRQLKYAGLFEAIRIRKAGYAVRVPLEAFVKRYDAPASQKAAIRLCDAALSGAGSAVAAADGMRRAYLDAKDLTSAQIAVGKTKVFLRDQKVRGLLEREYEKATSCRAFLARRFAKRLRVLSPLRRALKSADKTDLDAARDKAHAYLAARTSDGDVSALLARRARARSARRARGGPRGRRGGGRLAAALAALSDDLDAGLPADLAPRGAVRAAERALARLRAETGDAPAQGRHRRRGPGAPRRRRRRRVVAERLERAAAPASFARQHLATLSSAEAIADAIEVCVSTPGCAEDDADLIAQGRATLAAVAPLLAARHALRSAVQLASPSACLAALRRREPLTYLYGHGFLAAETHAATTLNALLPTLDRKKGVDVAPAENFLSGDALDVPNDAKLPPHVFEALDDARRAILPALKRKALAKADALLPRKKDRDDTDRVFAWVSAYTLPWRGGGALAPDAAPLEEKPVDFLSRKIERLEANAERGRRASAAAARRKTAEAPKAPSTTTTRP
ncbi:hypothetical protein JL722_13172 [Aureococcus anophagefferens]|nr:hypothetical protein JL722_13172 [Aureococcus anophagefferens]